MKTVADDLDEYFKSHFINRPLSFYDKNRYDLTQWSRDYTEIKGVRGEV